MSTGQIIIAAILFIGLIAFLLDVARNPDRYWSFDFASPADAPENVLPAADADKGQTPTPKRYLLWCKSIDPNLVTSALFDLCSYGGAICGNKSSGHADPIPAPPPISRSSAEGMLLPSIP